MNTSVSSDSSFLASADGISSAGSAEAINSEAENSQIQKANNRKNSQSSPNISEYSPNNIRHSTPSKSKTGLRFIVADSESEIEDNILDENSLNGKNFLGFFQ